MTVLSSSRPIPAPSGLVATITTIAKSLGVDANLALATAITESGLNTYAVGDGGTSFGLFQLHQGGELGNLTSTQAFNPVTNVTTALGEFQGVMAANPGSGFDGTSFSTPGDLAAASQRPQDRSAYATEVNYYYNQLASGIGVQDVTAYGGSGQAIGTSTGGAVQLDATQTAANSSTGGCGAKGNVFGEGGILGIGAFHFSYCNLKALTGTVSLLAGGGIMLIGAALVVVIGLGNKTPVGKALSAIVPSKAKSTASAVPSPSTVSASPSRPGSASSRSKPRSVGRDPDTFTGDDESLPSYAEQRRAA
jgi:hypothetical protein